MRSCRIVIFRELIFLFVFFCFSICQAEILNLKRAVIVVQEGNRPAAEQMAATMLAEEVYKRTGIQWSITSCWPDGKPVVAISIQNQGKLAEHHLPLREGSDLPESKPEGYRLTVIPDQNGQPIVWILGADARGTLYGAGNLLRILDMRENKIEVKEGIDLCTAPAYPIRGHQLGYRPQANSYDAWDVAQYEQYIRELVFFGVNSIENIPFHDSRDSPLMKIPRREMNRKLSEICARYGLDYWVWTPADYDLRDADARTKALTQHEQLYQDCRQLTGVFFPGGDPGENPPELVLPFLEEIAQRLQTYHPKARVWLSLQWFNKKQIDQIFRYIETQSPAWLGGLVAGPSSPPIPKVRNRLPENYKYRLYPDITHNKLCQYPVPWWDQAFALTLGREAINPRPVQYAMIHNWFAPYSDGFISYSDGVHDDMNKVIWSARSWNPQAKVRDILVEYSRVFFHPAVAEEAADGILALEKNWRGPLMENASVEGTLLQWKKLEKEQPELQGNWRWQMCLVRACYDAYIRHRLIHETRLEEITNTILTQAGNYGADTAMDKALSVLNQAVTQPVSTALKVRVEDLCEQLFKFCGLQTSVPKYHASGEERGAFLDFIDYPMNNRWWLEDQFKVIRQLPDEAQKVQRLMQLANWENPGPGSYYDDIGNTAKSPHVRRCEDVVTEPGEEAHPEPTLWWWDNGMSRARLSWQSSMNWPEAVVYEGLDPDASYRVRQTGYGKSLLRMDGQRVQPTLDGKAIGEFKEFPVDPKLIQDRKLVLTWDMPTDEEDLNWRQQSRISEIWLLKK